MKTLTAEQMQDNLQANLCALNDFGRSRCVLVLLVIHPGGERLTLQVGRRDDDQAMEMRLSRGALKMNKPEEWLMPRLKEAWGEHLKKLHRFKLNAMIEARAAIKRAMAA